MRNILSKLDHFSYDASARLRTSQLHSLFDGKILNEDNSFIFDSKGTGTGIYANNKFNMSVASGEYFIRQGKMFCQYSSGKSQLIELTFDNFHIESNVVKRVGYFSSNATAPYDASLDGFFLENDGTTYRIKCLRNGIETINIPFSNWDGYNQLSSYDWSQFTVIAFDFLWLGGAVLRLFVKTSRGFVLAHTIAWAGSNQDVFILSPNQPVRYEIRSSTGVGSFRTICSQVATEGQITARQGFNNSCNTGASEITLSSVATKYALIAIRKKVDMRNIVVKLTGAGCFVSTSDNIFWSVQRSPVLSTAMTFNDLPNSSIQYAIGSGTETITTDGKILASGYLTQNQTISPATFDFDFLSYLMSDLDDVMHPIVLCVQPLSANLKVYGSFNFKEN